MPVNPETEDFVIASRSAFCEACCSCLSRSCCWAAGSYALYEVSSSLKPFLLPLALEYKLSILNCSKSLLAPITGLAGLAYFKVNLIRPK